jgi:hypothetical protein
VASLSVPLTGGRELGTLGGVGHGSEGPVMRNQSLLRAGIKIAVWALAGFGLVKLLAYDRANRAPAPARCQTRPRHLRRVRARMAPSTPTPGWVCSGRMASR